MQADFRLLFAGVGVGSSALECGNCAGGTSLMKTLFGGRIVPVVRSKVCGSDGVCRDAIQNELPCVLAKAAPDVLRAEGHIIALPYHSSAIGIPFSHKNTAINKECSQFLADHQCPAFKESNLTGLQAAPGCGVLSWT